MTGVSLSVGCEREPNVLIFELSPKPLLLFRHRRGVRPEKGKGVESIVGDPVIQISRQRPVDDMRRLVEALQGKNIVGEIRVRKYITRCYGQRLASDLSGFLILPLLGVHPAQRIVRRSIPRVALNDLLKRLGRFIQFSGYV